jgi:hypothetical protein
MGNITTTKGVTGSSGRGGGVEAGNPLPWFVASKVQHYSTASHSRVAMKFLPHILNNKKREKD